MKRAKRVRFHCWEGEALTNGIGGGRKKNREARNNFETVLFLDRNAYNFNSFSFRNVKQEVFFERFIIYEILSSLENHWFDRTIQTQGKRELFTNYFKFLTGLNFANQPPTIPFFLQRPRDNSSPLTRPRRTIILRLLYPRNPTRLNTQRHFTSRNPRRHNATTMTILLWIARANGEYAAEETCRTKFYVTSSLKIHSLRTKLGISRTSLRPLFSLPLPPSLLSAKKKRGTRNAVSPS